MHASAVSPAADEDTTAAVDCVQCCMQHRERAACIEVGPHISAGTWLFKTFKALIQLPLMKGSLPDLQLMLGECRW